VRLLAEMGYRSLLMVPLLAGARSIGVLEACASAERPWSRTQIHRARVVGYLVRKQRHEARELRRGVVLDHGAVAERRYRRREPGHATLRFAVARGVDCQWPWWLP
jgi:GAF domain-containing protein